MMYGATGVHLLCWVIKYSWFWDNNKIFMGDLLAVASWQRRLVLLLTSSMRYLGRWLLRLTLRNAIISAWRVWINEFLIVQHINLWLYPLYFIILLIQNLIIIGIFVVDVGRWNFTTFNPQWWILFAVLLTKDSKFLVSIHFWNFITTIDSL